MNDLASTRLIAVAFSHGADIVIWRVSMTAEEVEQLRRALSNLRDLGHLVTYAITADGTCDWSTLIGDIGSRCSPSIVAACLAAPAYQDQAEPAFLMPVWAFHQQHGALVSTAQFLGLDLELVATLSLDEEVGAHLPGHPGRWLVRARAMF